MTMKCHHVRFCFCIALNMVYYNSRHYTVIRCYGAVVDCKKTSNETFILLLKYCR